MRCPPPRRCSATAPPLCGMPLSSAGVSGGCPRGAGCRTGCICGRSFLPRIQGPPGSTPRPGGGQCRALSTGAGAGSRGPAAEGVDGVPHACGGAALEQVDQRRRQDGEIGGEFRGQALRSHGGSVDFHEGPQHGAAVAGVAVVQEGVGDDGLAAAGVVDLREPRSAQLRPAGALVLMVRRLVRRGAPRPSRRGQAATDAVIRVVAARCRGWLRARRRSAVVLSGVQYVWPGATARSRWAPTHAFGKWHDGLAARTVTSCRRSHNHYRRRRGMKRPRSGPTAIWSSSSRNCVSSRLACRFSSLSCSGWRSPAAFRSSLRSSGTPMSSRCC